MKRTKELGPYTEAQTMLFAELLLLEEEYSIALIGLKKEMKKCRKDRSMRNTYKSVYKKTMIVYKALVDMACSYAIDPPSDVRSRWELEKVKSLRLRASAD